MRFSFKTIAIIVATAMSFYTILAVILYVIHEFPILFPNNNWNHRFYMYISCIYSNPFILD